jgi:uncharacterized protein involved in exopolysaccharide biosynthesis
MQEFHPAPDDERNSSRSLADTLGFLQRRRSALLAGSGLLMAMAVVTAFVLPAVYRSTATILIQEQEIPPELVRSTVTSFADERIQVISQQVMTRSVLLDLIDKYGLYADERKRETSEELLERMRHDIRITPISADVTDRRTGSTMKSTIAFSLAYDSESPANAQKITNQLTTLFLNENVKNRQQKAAETTSFLDEELDRVGKVISEDEQKLAEFKQRNQGRLPDLTQLNLAESERTHTDIQRLDRELGFVAERRAALEGQLAETRPSLPIVSVGGTIPDPEDQLQALQTQLASLVGIYSEDHPDIRRLRREIANLKSSTTGGAEGEVDDAAAIEALRAKLTLLRQQYAEDHPDVQRARRSLAALEGAAASAAARSASGAMAADDAMRPRRADNPAYQNLKQQIATLVAQTQSMQTERHTLQARLDDLDLRLHQAPEVERGYFELARDLDSSRTRFRELREKQMQAQVAEQLERERKAERFTLIDPPIYPEKPVRPNRPLILLIGLVLALGGGVAAAVLHEALDSTVHGARDLARLLRAPVLAVVPTSPSALALRRRGTRLRWALGTSVLFAALLLAGVHFLYLPLDVAWYAGLRRISN